MCGQIPAQSAIAGIGRDKGADVKALFGMVSLLVVVAIVGMLAARQLRSVSAPLAAAGGSSGVPSVAASGTLRQPARQMEQQVADDAAKALAQGAQARQDAADDAGKP
jgi:hypothetical protein